MERTESTEKKLTTPSTEVQEKPGRWRFAVEYKLRILGTTDYENLLLIENPVGNGNDFQLTTCLVSFKPSAAWQQAGLVCFNAPGNYMKWVELVAKNGSRTSAPEIDASFDFFEIREIPVAPYALPTGGAETMLTFIEELRKLCPESDWDVAEHKLRAPRALKEAANRILSLETDESSNAYQAAMLVLLEDYVGVKQDVSGFWEKPLTAEYAKLVWGGRDPATGQKRKTIYVAGALVHIDKIENVADRIVEHPP